MYFRQLLLCAFDLLLVRALLVYFYSNWSNKMIWLFQAHYNTIGHRWIVLVRKWVTFVTQIPENVGYWMVHVQQQYICTEKYFCMAGKWVTKVTQTYVKTVRKLPEFQLTTRNVLSSTGTEISERRTVFCSNLKPGYLVWNALQEFFNHQRV